MPITLSFGGSGHYFPFMLGIAHGLRTHFSLDWEQVHVHCISSGCAGALAVLLCTPTEIERIALKAITLAHKVDRKNRTVYYSQLIKNLVPYNAYRRVGRRLIAGTTETPLMRSFLHCRGYESQQELLTTLYASCRIPFLTGTWNRHIDGGFSQQYATVDDNTIVITLKQHPRSDLFAARSLYFREMLLPSREKMYALYEQGKRVVSENYNSLEQKIIAGLNTPDEGEVRFRTH